MKRLAAGVLGSLVALGACTASSEEVRPPSDELFFPTGVAVSPDEGTLFVVSANSDLRFDSGTIGVLDLAEVDDVVGAWLGGGTVPGDCHQDLTFPETLVCDERVHFLQPGSGVRIGNFATTVGIQDRGGGNLRLVVPVRGDPSVTWIDWDGAVLECGGGEGFPLCSDEHRLTRMLDDDGLPQIADEPYGVFVDSTTDFAVVTHLNSGTATLVDLAGGAPVLSDVISGIFASDSAGRRGSLGVAGRTPDLPDDLVYVTSSTEQRVQTFTVARPNGGLAALVPGDLFFLDRIGTNAGASSNTRAVAFGQGGDRAYFLNREPPSIGIVDTSLDATGTPRNEVIGAVDVCREASALAVADVGEGERAFVTCFNDGELYVVDLVDDAGVEAITSLGRGPFSVAAAPTRNRLYVSNFYENTVAVIDLTPGAPTQYRVVLRIGRLTESTES